MLHLKLTSVSGMSVGDQCKYESGNFECQTLFSSLETVGLVGNYSPQSDRLGDEK